MRFIVCGAGAIGGVVGGRLFEAGHDVVLVARGAHLATIRSGGLRLVSEGGTAVLPIPAFGDVAEIDWRDGDVVLLTVKTHQTQAILDALVVCAPPDTPIVCLQNGVASEGMALRLFPEVYGGLGMCAALHLEPGEVTAYQWPEAGILDIGRFPHGSDATADAISRAWSSATFRSESRDDIMAWKRQKLVMNLGNGLDVLCGPTTRYGPLGEQVRAEGERVMSEAGLDMVTQQDLFERMQPSMGLSAPQGVEYPGSSTWQSTARGSSETEADYLNGEIVLLGRLHGVATPVNELIQELTRRFATAHIAPGTMSEESLGQLLAGL